MGSVRTTSTGRTKAFTKPRTNPEKASAGTEVTWTPGTSLAVTASAIAVMSQCTRKLRMDAILAQIHGIARPRPAGPARYLVSTITVLLLLLLLLEELVPMIIRVFPETQ